MGDLEGHSEIAGHPQEIEFKPAKKATQDPKKLHEPSSVPNNSSLPNNSQPTSQAENPDDNKEEITKQAPPEQQLLGSDG